MVGLDNAEVADGTAGGVDGGVFIVGCAILKVSLYFLRTFQDLIVFNLILLIQIYIEVCDLYILIFITFQTKEERKLSLIYLHIEIINLFTER